MGKEITEFGRKVEQAQQIHNVSNGELARKMQIQGPQVFSLKKTAKPRHETLIKLSRAPNTPVEFFTSNEPMKPVAQKVIVRKGPLSQARAQKSAETPNLDSSISPSTRTEDDPRQITLDELALRAQVKPQPSQISNTTDSAAAAETSLKVFISFEVDGKVVSRKQIKRLPVDFEF